MSEATSSIFIFLGVAILCSLISHTLIKRISIAILFAAITTALIFQIIAYLLAGYFEPFYLITTFIYAFIIALIISVPFKLWRRLKNEQKNSAT